MSVVTDFTSAYTPVQVIRIPLSASVYDSQAISGLAEITTGELAQLSGGLSDYVTRGDLSTAVHTNELSAGVLSVSDAVFSVEPAGEEDRVLTVNGVRVYNLTGGNVVQSVLPRHVFDAGVMVFNPVADRYFMLRAFVDVTNPTLARVEPVEVDISQLTQGNFEVCKGVYMRLPGGLEWYSAMFATVKISPTGVATFIPDWIHGDRNELQLARVADGILFTGNQISTTGEVVPEKLVLTVDAGGNWKFDLDPLYLHGIVESQIEALAAEVGGEITTIQNSLTTLQENVREGFTSVDTAVGELSTGFNNRLTALNQRVSELEQEFADKINYLSGVCDEQWEQINSSKNALTAVVSKLSGIAQLNATDTFGTHMNVTNRVLSVLANLLV